jgi:aminoglycoside phosphotransferase (APT) family kinase protein
VHTQWRIGGSLVARLPRVPASVPGLARELRWLPELAPRLPVAVPEPVGAGAPGGDYPFPWAVYRWIAGTNPAPGRLDDPDAVAAGLADFVRTMRSLPVSGAPAAGSPSSGRGGALVERDAAMRAALSALRRRPDAEIEATALRDAWDRVLASSVDGHRACWIHGDLGPGNVLVAADGRLSAVIDFGSTGIGDPALDLIAAWTLLPAGSRADFRRSVGAGEDEWRRARGWALSIATIQLPYYRDSDPAFAAVSRSIIRAVLEDGV